MSNSIFNELYLLRRSSFLCVYPIYEKKNRLIGTFRLISEIIFVNFFPGHIQNKTILVQLTEEGHTESRIEQALYNESSNTGILSEVMTHQLDLETVSHGSVVLQLRPITDQAVQTLLNAKHNNKLVEMIYGMLKQVDIEKILNDTEPLKIRVNVCYANSVEGKPGKLPHGLNKIKE